MRDAEIAAARQAFETVREDTFLKLSILTRTVKGDAIAEAALLDLTGAVLATTSFSELRPYSSLFRQLPVSWPYAVVSSEVLACIIHQCVLLSEQARLTSTNCNCRETNLRDSGPYSYAPSNKNAFLGDS